MQYIIGALVGFFVGFSGIILMGRMGAAAPYDSCVSQFLFSLILRYTIICDFAE